MRTVKEPDIRRQEILDGAIKVFAKNGYDRATISTIAKELNISQGLCYRYFSSKEDIYNAAIEKYSDIIFEEYLNGKNTDTPVSNLIDNISSNIAKLITAESKDDSLYILFHSENSEKLHNQLLLKVAEKILPHLQSMLCRAKERGEISIADPENTAIIGLYGEIGILLAPHLTEKQRIEAIQTGWKRLLCL